MYQMKVNSIRMNHLQKNNRNINANAVDSQRHSFQALLQKEIHKSQGFKFSKHALERLEERKIQLTNQEVDKLNSAINKAAEKGIKETLIIMDNKAFIASVPNRTVITAAMDQQLKENIFTNIDGAVFI